MAFMRRFYLKQSVFEFDPIEMLFAALFHAIKVEEVNLDLDTFCQKVNQPSQCNPQSKVPDYTTEVLALEVLLLRGLGFQLAVHTPFQVYDHVISVIQEKLPHGSNIASLRKRTVENINKCFLNDFLIFIYTPSQLALACVDLVITQSL